MNFQLDVTRTEAMSTDRFPLPPEAMLAAYNRTLLRPARGVLLDHRTGCADPAGALAADAVQRPDPAAPPAFPPALDSYGVEEIMVALGVPEHLRGATEDWLSEFGIAFDRPTMEMLEMDTAAQVQDPNIPGWQVLAWRNALACRRALVTECMEPIAYE